MYAYLYEWWFVGVLLILVLPLLVIFVLELVAAAMPPTENAAMQLASQRRVRGEIDERQLRVLLNAL